MVSRLTCRCANESKEKDFRQKLSRLTCAGFLRCTKGMAYLVILARFTKVATISWRVGVTITARGQTIKSGTNCKKMLRNPERVTRKFIVIWINYPALSYFFYNAYVQRIPATMFPILFFICSTVRQFSRHNCYPTAVSRQVNYV